MSLVFLQEQDSIKILGQLNKIEFEEKILTSSDRLVIAASELAANVLLNPFFKPSDTQDILKLALYKGDLRVLASGKTSVKAKRNILLARGFNFFETLVRIWQSAMRSYQPNGPAD